MIVIMGPAGAGKTTVGLLLAQSLGWNFLDADDFHSRANIEKMHRGIGLTDADREPWLSAMRDALKAQYTSGANVVLACSALKKQYRQALVPEATADALRFVYLRAPESVLRNRLAHRTGHYAGADLLASQLETLEEPSDALWVDATCQPAEIVATIRRELAL
jgi:gluconokinase